MSTLKDEMIALLFDCVAHYAGKEGTEGLYSQDTLNRHSELQDEIIALLYDCVEHYSEKEGEESIQAIEALNRYSDLMMKNPKRKSVQALAEQC